MAIDSIRLNIEIPELLVSTPPIEFKIFPKGEFETSKGNFSFGELSAQRVMSEFQLHGQDRLPIDFDHQMLGSGQAPEAAIAAGWFVPEMRNGELWATDVQWTPRALEMLGAREFRFLSPAFSVDDSNSIVELINVALTNLPATREAEPLVANKNTAPQTSVADRKVHKKVDNKLLVALGAADESEALVIAKEFNTWSKDILKATSAESLNDALDAVKANAQLPSEVASLSKELEAIKTKQAIDDRESLIAKLSKGGKLPPALHVWARTQSIESLNAFGDAAPELATGPVGQPVEASIALTAEDEKIIKLTGMSREAFIVERKLQLDKGKG